MARHVPRVFLPQAIAAGEQISIEGDAAHHLLRVLRVKPGASLVLFNGQGGEYRASISAVERHALQVDVSEFVDISRESVLRVTLLQGIARKEHMDYAIAKAVELGVNAIQPLQLDRSQGMDEYRLAKKQAHWQAMAQSAAEQSGRTHVPEVSEACRFEAWLNSEQHYDLCLILHPDETQALSDIARPASVALLVGPEGGLTDEEVALARANGFLPLALGPRILRTETAAMTAVGLVQARWGDLIV